MKKTIGQVLKAASTRIGRCPGCDHCKPKG